MFFVKLLEAKQLLSAEVDGSFFGAAGDMLTAFDHWRVAPQNQHNRKIILGTLDKPLIESESWHAVQCG